MKRISTLLLCSFLLAELSAQPCATTVAAGSASNAFTNVEGSTNSIAVDNELNTVIFIHRNNAGTFGGHSGQLRYDISMDNGTTWTSNQGVLNPLSVNGTNGARYPQVAIYNPTGNTIPTNAYLSYFAPTTAATFNGLVSGVRQLNGTGNTETYNQPAASQTNVPSSMCKGANGIEWAMDPVFNGTNITGYRVYKGTWNGSNDFVWSTNTTITPSFNTAYNGFPQVSDVNIGFDPTGQYGWICLLTHLTGGPANYAFYPVFYRTTDGGNTWSSAMQVDINRYSCISSNIAVGNFATCGFDGDLVVDANGEPHFLTSVCNGNNAYAIYFTFWHHMFDFTWHGGMFNAMDVSNVNAGRGTWGVAPNQATMDNQPMASRSADGTKVFFGWCDNSTYAVGQANQTPNLFSRAYDVATHNWTVVRDFTACNVTTNGQMLLPKMATEVLEPTAGTYRLAVVHGVFTAGDPINTCNFTFLNNLEWTNAEFTIPQPFTSVNIAQGNIWLLCPGGTVGLTTGIVYDEVVWSTGDTTGSLIVNSPGTYSIMARTGCLIAADTIQVIGVTATPSVSTSTICPGDSTLLTVAGNALSYLWNPGNFAGDSLIADPTATTTYTLTSGGDGGCTFDTTITVNVHPAPAVAASAASSSICIGDSTLLSASGAVTYIWQPMADSSASVVVTPNVNGTYTVSGTDANGCVGVDSVSVLVNPLPVVAMSSPIPVACFDDGSIALSGSGSPIGGTFSGTGVTDSTFIPMNAGVGTHIITYMYTDVNGCSAWAIDSIMVDPCLDVAAANNTLISVYPNPFSEQITLTMYANSPVQITVRNVTGQQIHAQQFSGNVLTLGTSEWAAGIYLLTVNSGTAEEQTLRLIKY